MTVLGHPADEATAHEILRAERDLYGAMIARNFAALERALSPDLVYVHSTAVAESRDEYLAGMADGLYEYDSIESRDVRVRVHNSVAFLDGVCDMRVGSAGKSPELIHLLFVLAWVRDGSTWRLVHRQATRIRDEQPRT